MSEYGKWIPVEERLPDDFATVNVTWINRSPEPYYESIKDVPFTATAVYYNGNWYWWSSTCVDYLKEYGKCDWDLVDKDIDIIAWAPLPETYKPAPPAPHWKDRMMNTFLGERREQC